MEHLDFWHRRKWHAEGKGVVGGVCERDSGYKCEKGPRDVGLGLGPGWHVPERTEPGQMWFWGPESDRSKLRETAVVFAGTEVAPGDRSGSGKQTGARAAVSVRGEAMGLQAGVGQGSREL